MTGLKPKALRVERSRAGCSRLMAEFDAGPDGLAEVVREVPRPANVHAAYSYSPEWSVYRWEGREVVLVETAHRRFELFAVEDLECSTE